MIVLRPQEILKVYDQGKWNVTAILNDGSKFFGCGINQMEANEDVVRQMREAGYDAANMELPRWPRRFDYRKGAKQS